MTVLDFFTWCEQSRIGEAIRDSKWLFPAIESFHLLALAVLGGAVLLVNLRLMGLTLKGQPVPQLWRDTRPWLLWSLGVMLVSGVLLFFSEATKLYYHEAFWVKMTSLGLAILFTFTVQRRTAIAHDAGRGRHGTAQWRRFRFCFGPAWEWPPVDRIFPGVGGAANGVRLPDYCCCCWVRSESALRAPPRMSVSE
jgi:amino acid permease